MALYSYKKKHVYVTKKTATKISYVLMFIGSVFLFWSFYPIIYFEIYSRFFIQDNFSSPVPKSEIVSSLEEANSVSGSYSNFSTNLSDFTKVGNWFPSKPQAINKKFKVDQYLLSIPKLNIKNAVVIVGGEDLTKYLSHYSPISLPGEYGNVNIFGHSTLPQLYDVKDYKTIFTYLPSLEKGDRLFINIDGITYEYEVYDMFVVNPDQVSVLDQRYDNAYITLITCVPPGTYWKRLVVRAKMVKL